MEHSEDHLNILQEKLSTGEARLFDVREQEEWDEGHLVGAEFVPLSGLNEGSEPAEKEGDQPIYLYCRSGNRVQLAQPILEDMGFKKVIALEEGYEELRDEGFSVVEAD